MSRGDPWCSRFPSFLVAWWALVAAAAGLAILLGPASPAAAPVRAFAARGKLWHNAPGAPGAPRPPGTGATITRRVLRSNVPQRFFSHFYVVGVVCTGLLLGGLLLPGGRGAEREAGEGGVLLLALFLAHVCRRWYESTHVAVYSSQARMHLAGYAFGLAFYVLVPISLLPWDLLSAAACDAVEAGGEGWRSLGRKNGGGGTWWPVAGSALFAYGSFHQNRCHRLLAGLRTKRERRAGAQGRGEATTVHGYELPRGGWFELVACPHYLAEVILYAGLLLTSGGSALVAGVCAWVVANLSLAALDTREWYVRHFDDFPSTRRAIFPGLL